MRKKISKIVMFIEENLVVIIFFLMTLITIINVFTRYFFSYTASWSEQVTRIMFVYVGFIGISICARKDSNLKVEALPFFLRPRAGAFIRALGDLISIVFGYYISWKIFETTLNLIKTQQSFAAIPSVPVWIMYIIGAIGMFGFACHTIPRFIKRCKQFLGIIEIPEKDKTGIEDQNDISGGDKK